MIANIVLTAGRTVAELIGIDQQAGEGGIVQQAGQVTLTWVVAVLIMLGVLLIAFRKSKRTHLD